MSSSQLTNSMILWRGRSTTHQRGFFCDLHYLHVTPVGLVRESLVSLVFPLRPWKAVDERGPMLGPLQTMAVRSSNIIITSININCLETKNWRPLTSQNWSNTSTMSNFEIPTIRFNPCPTKTYNISPWHPQINNGWWSIRKILNPKSLRDFPRFHPSCWRKRKIPGFLIFGTRWGPAVAVLDL